MARWQQSLDEKMPFQQYCDDNAIVDVEAQQSSNQVHSVAMSIPAFLVWHVLSFILGILTTVLMVWGFMTCGVGVGSYTALGP
jgi:hypothetical protein